LTLSQKFYKNFQVFIDIIFIYDILTPKEILFEYFNTVMAEVNIAVLSEKKCHRLKAFFK